MSYGVIYKITNIANDKFYIGQTISPLEKRWCAHVKDAKAGKPWLMCAAIRKYGKENFSKEILAYADDKESLNKLEIQFIKELEPHYNMCKGGGGLGSPTAEVRLKIAKSHRGRKRTEDQSKAQSIRQLGRKLSEETKLKIRNSQLGRSYPERQTGMSYQQRKIRRDELYMSKLPEEIRTAMAGMSKNEKISFRAKLDTTRSERMRGELNPMYGKIKSDAEKQNLSAKMQGDKNPYYGRMHSSEALEKMRLAHFNRPKISCPHCGKEGIVSNMKRWHLDNCKEKQ